MGIAQAKDFTELFYKRESLWDFLKLQCAAILLFTAVAWGPLAAHAAVGYLHLPKQGVFASQISEIDRWLVVPQVRLILYFSTTLTETWPGPIGASSTDAHRLLLGLVYGTIGCAVGWFVYRAQEWWPLRLAWLFAAFFIWTVFFQGLTFIFFFVVDSTGRLLSTPAGLE